MKEGIPTVPSVGTPACCCALASGEDACLLLSSGLRGPLQNTVHQTQSLNKTVKHSLEISTSLQNIKANQELHAFSVKVRSG